MNVYDIDMELAAGCTVPVSARIPLVLASKLKRSGRKTSEVIKEGIELVLNGGFAPVSAPISAPGDGMKPEVAELWALHKQYVDAAGDAEELESAWADFDIAMFEISEKIPDEARAYFNAKENALRGDAQ